MINYKLGDYIITGDLTHGAFGKIYSGIHYISRENVIIKFSQDHEKNDLEYEILEKVHSKV